MNKTEIIQQNRIRNRIIKEQQFMYNPIIGCGSNVIERTLVEIQDLPIPKFYAPNQMFNHPLIQSLITYKSITQYLTQELDVPATKELVDLVIDKVERIRKKTDFEYTAVKEFRIKPKAKEDETDIGDVPFIPNRAQRKLLKKLEKLRLSNKPIRIILLKARQWGGSTLIQLYMAWIQLYHKKQWNSVICAHLDATARIIKGMYDKLLKYISPYEIEGNINPIQLKPYVGSTKTSIIKQRDCRITIGSAESPDGVRGEDVTMAHLSEIGVWKKTDGKSPEDIINSICSGIPYVSLSMIAYESTAKGVGNFFHREWRRAKEKKSMFQPIFIPWFEIDSYSMPIENYCDFIESMSEYECNLWSKGATLEQIAWYRMESTKYSDQWSMRQEYPSDDIEAFQSTGRRKFDIYHVQQMREKCRPPLYYGNVQGNSTSGTEALQKLQFIKTEKTQNTDGLLFVWSLPSNEKIKNRYVVSVDVGGKSSNADWSIIKVFDRKYMTEPGGIPEVAAQWRGHIDHDLLAWKAAQIAAFYNNALLVIESNTLETEQTEGQHFEYILEEISKQYNNLYCRNSAERIKEGLPPKWGFHTNKSTKTLIADHMVKMLRDQEYVERDQETCNEMDTYEIKENGSLGAVDGNHDDALMATMIGVFVCYDFDYIPIPEYYETQQTTKKQKEIYSEASF